MNKRLEELLNNFDYEEVKKIMLFMDWKWGYGKDMEIPTISGLKELTKRLYKDLQKHDDISSGGLRLERCKNGSLYLSFSAVDYLTNISN